MDFSTATAWWVAAGIAVAAELGTGTFYLLMIALGLAAGAVAAHLGFGTSAQLIVAAVVGGGSTALWYWKRRLGDPTGDLAARQNRDVNLDIGEPVHVTSWSADRTARVQYRGSGWTARLAPGAPPVAGEHVVVAVEGNWLVLAPSSRA